MDIVTITGHDVVMKAVNVADLKSRLSRHLRAVRAGEVVTVLDRSTPVARIVPIETDEDLVITKPPAGAPALGAVALPRSRRIPVDAVALLLDDRRRR